MRVLCVWFPGWPLGRPDAPSDRPVLIVAGGRVVALGPEAAGAGVESGMSRRQAEAMCPGAVCLDRDLLEETTRFDPVVGVIEDVIPRVEVVEPGLVLIPTAGAVRYYGSEQEVAELVGGKLSAAGHDVRLGIADGPFAATWAARRSSGDPMIVSDTRRFLAGLDVSSLGHDDAAAIFRWLGVVTLGELADLPREAVASRFGAPGLEMHRLAQGEDRVVSPRVIPPELAVESRFEEPLESLDRLAFASRALAARLMDGLRRRGVSPYRILVAIEAVDGTSRERVWRSASPFDEGALADRLWWQARAWVESGRLPGGVTRLRIDPSDLTGEGRQGDLFEDLAPQLEADRALARAQALLGPDAVLQADPHGGRMPGERISWRRWGEPVGADASSRAAPWPGATPRPTPALVAPEPTRLQVEWEDGTPVRVRLGTRWEPVVNWAGPWRLTGRWWNEEGPWDRYQIVTSAGALLCVVDERGTFLAGVYD